MSKHFSAEQYENAYLPHHLSQWEVPKKFQEYPKRRKGCTFPISDENGRFVIDVNKPKFKEWSSFVGTWGRNTNYAKPGNISSDPVSPGVWMIKGRKARWVEAVLVQGKN